jgi:conjugative relaxase-like TrwC/TraI family protein
MMQIHTAASPEYYLTPDYQTEGNQIESAWGGRGAKMLGMDEFGPLSFLRLSKGLNPETGTKLTARLKENRRSAWDVSVTVPKSVSILIEVLGRDDVKDALQEANSYMMGKLEKQAEVRVRKGGVYEDRLSGNIAYASFYHGTTRPAKDDKLPDPHSHIHNYMLNLAFDKKERQWKALQIGNIDRPGIEKIFHKRLARNLKSLGYSLDEQGKYFEVRGVSQDLIGLYSRRNYEVERFAAEKGYQSDKAKAKLGQYTRSPKIGNLSMDDVRKYWIAKLTPPQLDNLLSVEKRARFTLSKSRWMQNLKNHFTKSRSAANQEQGIEQAIRQQQYER